MLILATQYLPILCKSASNTGIDCYVLSSEYKGETEDTWLEFTNAFLLHCHIFNGYLNVSLHLYNNNN